MLPRKILGAVLFLIGVALICVSLYIRREVEQGKMQIADAQEKVDEGTRLFSFNPVTKEVGKGVTGHIQKKIDEGTATVEYYESLAGWLMTGGIVLVLLGPATILIKPGKRRSR